MSKKNIRFIWLLIIFSLKIVYGGGEELRKQERLLENYEMAASTEIVSIVRRDLISNDIMRQDAGCIILLRIFERLKRKEEKAEFIFSRLSGDEKVVYAAADIIDSRLLGWYNGESTGGNVDEVKIYTPLLYILGKADSKTARGTLVRSFLYLNGRNQIIDEIPVSEELIGVSLKMLKVLSGKLCCLYPGKDLVAGMLEKNSRMDILNMFEKLLSKNDFINEKTKREIVAFAAECMEYGDAKNGYQIRIRAIQLAGRLITDGEKDLLPAIVKVSKNDPYYIHDFNEKTGFSMTKLYYPVRTVCMEILSSVH